MSDKGYLKALETRPHERQLKWQSYEYYCILSFGMNTIRGVEWGDGFTPVDFFWPENIDTDKWAEFVKEIGMSAVIFTAKHFDGFCLWQTDMTDYSVKSCKNWKDGKGDLVAEMAESCKKYGLGFGIDITPWDKHEASYGSGKAYDDFFCGLLTELLTKYGDLFCVRFDFRAGTGVNGTFQNFDLDRYYKTVRELQPDCCITCMGPDARRHGSEKFAPRKSEWSVVPESLYSGGNKKFNFASPDLGSRKQIKKEENFIWYPLEVAVPLRDHWFYNKDDNYSAKTKDKLWKLYLDSVGSNANFVLGICPDKKGKFNDTDVQILKSFGADLKLHFGYNLITEKGRLEASSSLSEMYKAENMINDNADSFWRADGNDERPSVTIILDEPDLFDKIVIKEHIRNGQRVEAFDIQVIGKKGKWQTVYEGTVIGYKKICPLDTMKCDKIKIVFTQFRDIPEISYISLN